MRDLGVVLFGLIGVVLEPYFQALLFDTLILSKRPRLTCRISNRSYRGAGSQIYQVIFYFSFQGYCRGLGRSLELF